MVIQDLLIGFGNRHLPDARQASYGTYGPATTGAIRQFRTINRLTGSDAVDAGCLAALASGKPTDPIACRSYIALCLDMEVNEMTYLTTLTGLWEGGARFAVLNLNSDRAGLSFGLIQWAQKPGRLHELLLEFQQAAAGRFDATFGGEAAASGLLQHTAKKSGGVEPSTGNTTDPDFDLVATPWVDRFQAAGLDPVFQRVQISVATTAAQNAYKQVKDQAPLIASKRGVGFLLDTANQHGPAGALAIYRAVLTPGLTESALLQRMRDESVRRVAAQFGAESPEAKSTASRRDWFLATTALSSDPFTQAAGTMTGS